jgi:hypothetical protein
MGPQTECVDFHTFSALWGVSTVLLPQASEYSIFFGNISIITHRSSLIHIVFRSETPVVVFSSPESILRPSLAEPLVPSIGINQASCYKVHTFPSLLKAPRSGITWQRLNDRLVESGKNNPQAVNHYLLLHLSRC